MRVIHLEKTVSLSLTLVEITDGRSSALEGVHACSVAKWCLTLCDPMDCSPPGSSVHGISQGKIMEWKLAG